MGFKRKRPHEESEDGASSSKNFSIHALVGLKSGLIKGISLEGDKIEAQTFNLEYTPKGNQLVSTFYESQENKITAGYSDQFVRVFDIKKKVVSHSQSYANNPLDTLVAITKHKGRVVTATKGGCFSIWNNDKSTSTQTLNCKISGDRKMKQPTLQFLRNYGSTEDIIATGGCENDLALWNLENPQKEIFKAKNVAPDKLDLRVPVWVVDAAFCGSPTVVATCNQHNEATSYVRLYDTRAKQRPVVNIEFSSPLSRIVAHPQISNEVLVGHSKGRIERLDLRKKSPKVPVTTYKTFLGSVKDIAVVPNQKLLLCVSLDRYLRAFDLDSGGLLYEWYTNSMPCSVLQTEELEKGHQTFFKSQRKGDAVTFRNLYKKKSQ